MRFANPNEPPPNYALLAELHAIVDGIPEGRVDMGLIAHDRNRPSTPSPHSCGTVACAMGWFAMHPLGQAHGLSLSGKGNSLLLNGAAMQYRRAASKVFNITELEACELFCSASGEVSDKEVFKRRVREFFIQNGVPVRSEA